MHLHQLEKKIPDPSAKSPFDFSDHHDVAAEVENSLFEYFEEVCEGEGIEPTASAYGDFLALMMRGMVLQAINTREY